MGLVSEFKAFAMRGNVVDMAVGVIIGGAFGKIVSSLVNDVLMPPIGKLMGGVNFSSLYVALDGNTYASIDEAKKATAIISYGAFFQTVLDFVIIAFAIFMMIKALNSAKKKEVPAPAAPPAPSAEAKLLGEIRDLLKARG
jgi:large conductance mechanosensitive channel